MREILLFLGIIHKEEYYNTLLWSDRQFWTWLFKGKPPITK